MRNPLDDKPNSKFSIKIAIEYASHSSTTYNNRNKNSELVKCYNNVKSISKIKIEYTREHNKVLKALFHRIVKYIIGN